MDALIIYEILHGPSDGYFSTLLYNDDFAKGFNGRLDLVYDLRFRPKATWEVIEFADTTKAQLLSRDEIYGYLKARFPEKNWRKFICEKVKEMTLKLFETFPDEEARP